MVFTQMVGERIKVGKHLVTSSPSTNVLIIVKFTFFILFFVVVVLFLVSLMLLRLFPSNRGGDFGDVGWQGYGFVPWFRP
jgi:hypothetical protein